MSCIAEAVHAHIISRQGTQINTWSSIVVHILFNLQQYDALHLLCLQEASQGAEVQ